jgi:ABC-type ATPase involved in cell division
VITFEDVSKRFGERMALDHLSWHMDEGEAVAFLGSNGSGKTTVLRLITHEIQPTSGKVTVGTFHARRLRRGHRALLRRTLGIIYEDLAAERPHGFENVALAVRIADGSPTRGDSARDVRPRRGRPATQAECFSVRAVRRREAARRHRAGDRQPPGGDPGR